MNEYDFAINNIHIEKLNNKYYIVIDNQLLNDEREEGLFIHLEKLLLKDNHDYVVSETYSTSKRFALNPDLIDRFKDAVNNKEIGRDLTAELFYFKRNTHDDVEGYHHLEKNIISAMPSIVTSKFPMLEAAKANSQVEFDRVYRTIVKSQHYKNKRVVYISGLNIDISPEQGQVFPLTKFVPWAAFIQDKDGHQKIIEQQELYDILNLQSNDNPDQIDLDKAIEVMESELEIII